MRNTKDKNTLDDINLVLFITFSNISNIILIAIRTKYN